MTEHRDIYDTLKDLRTERDALKVEVERLREVLAWYADKDNWRTRDHYSSPGHDFPAWTENSEAQKELGKRARAALSPAKPLPETATCPRCHGRTWVMVGATKHRKRKDCPCCTNGTGHVKRSDKP